MDQSRSCQANSRAASKKVFRFPWKPKIHYRVHKSPSLDFSELHESSPHPHTFLKIHFNIILPSARTSPKWSLSFKFSDWIFVYISHHK